MNDNKFSLITSKSGDIVIIFSSIMWAFYSLFLSKAPKVITEAELTTILFLGSAVLCGLLMIWNPMSESELEFRSNQMFSFLCVSLLARIVAYISWKYGLKLLGPQLASQFL